MPVAFETVVDGGGHFGCWSAWDCLWRRSTRHSPTRVGTSSASGDLAEEDGICSDRTN